MLLRVFVSFVLAVAFASQPAVGEAKRFELTGDASLEMVWIAGGKFEMGFVHPHSTHDIDEEPVHEVRIGGFYLAVQEVTRTQWVSVMGTSPWGTVTEDDDDGSRPATHISWLDAQEFIKRLNISHGETAYRLPTEAEWEYASRAGTTTTWPFGDTPADVTAYAWCKDNISDVGRHPPVAGTRRPNPWGFLDLAGSTWEWCSDWYGMYELDAQTDPRGPVDGFAKVIRGGAYVSYCWETRPTNRGSLMPDEHSAYVGFRLAR